MKTLRILVAAAIVASAIGLAGKAQAEGPRVRAYRLAYSYAAARPWHGNYYHTNYGVPLALLVPPHSKMMTSYGWGVTATEINPIYHQFGRTYPGELASGGMMVLPTPPWPSHTDQFGVYPIRGPW